MVTKKIYFQPTWSIDIYEGINEIVQRMGWAMDMEQDTRNRDLWIGIVNVPIEDEKLFELLESGWMEYDEC